MTGHLKLKECVLLEQILSQLTHTMSIILWIDTYIMCSVCELKSLYSSIGRGCFFAECKCFEENTGLPPKEGILSSSFCSKATVSHMDQMTCKCCWEGQQHLEIESWCSESWLTDLIFFVYPLFTMFCEDKQDLLSSFRRIIWRTENKVASEGEAASLEVFCVVPALGGTQHQNIKV